MDKGFIKLSRKFFSNRIWKAARTFSECEAWLDLIQSARFEATETIECIGDREIKYGRGQYPASIRFLAKKWSWNERAVRSFLTKLKNEKMITTDKGQGMNVITLCKYDEYNSSDTANDTANDTDTAKEIKRLTELVTQLTTQQMTQPRHTGDTKKKKEEENNNNNSSCRSSDELLCGTSPHSEKINYKSLVEFFNGETKGVFGYIRYPISEKRRGMINARIGEHGKKAFVEMIRKALASDFLRGQNSRGFVATFDWLIRPTNFEKVISGNYDNRNDTIKNAAVAKRYGEY